MRTFILLALLGAAAGWLSRTLSTTWILAAALLIVGAFVGVGYVITARASQDGKGLTTETAAIGVCLLGAPGRSVSEVALALGVAVSATVLAYKQPLHDLVAQLATDDIEAGVKLLVASFIVLPLLPREPIDPWGAIEPHSLWLLVILIAGLSLVGYVATRALGPGRGTAAAGLAGGLVSSTAVTLSFARRSREDPEMANALACGALIAWAVMFVRVVILVAVVYRALLVRSLLPFLALAAVTLALAALLLHGRTRVEERARWSAGRKPLQPDRGRPVRGAVRGRAAGGQDRPGVFSAERSTPWRRLPV